MSLLLLLACAARRPVEAGPGDVFSLGKGDCFDDPDLSQDEVDSVPVVDCRDPHHNEIFHVFDAPEGPYDEALVEGLAEVGCSGQAFEDFVGVPYADSELLVVWMSPTHRSWVELHDREILCMVYLPEGAKLTGSVKGSRR